jgi:ribosomal protein S12 methylthiotransferase accessory factor
VGFVLAQAIDLAAECPKVVGSYDRCVSLETTLALIPRIRTRYGITRLGNITRLDRIGIPTFCSITPTSAASLSVHNGKGVSNEAALVGAAFEAVERHIAASPQLKTFQRNATKIAERIDLDRLGIEASAKWTKLDCVQARDVLNERDVLVPLALVQLRRTEPPLFPIPTSNGLASGNTLIEATYHALCELIERHAWSLYSLRCELLPRIMWGSDAPNLNFSGRLRMPSGFDALDALAERIESAGLHLRISYLPEPHLPAVMLASIVEDHSDPPMSHIGLGCSLSPAHAALRAITEAAQSRLTDIQGAREDALRADDDRGDLPEHTRKLSKAPKDTWFFDLPARTIELQSIPDASTADLAEDLRRVLLALTRFGASSAIVVDMSPTDVPVNVVRAIVPELETTCLDGRIGPKAMNALNPFGTTSPT